MAEQCSTCAFWDGGPGGPEEMQEMGLCNRLSGEGTDQAFTVDNGDFMCAGSFYCSEYQDGQQSMDIGNEAGFTDTPLGFGRSGGPGGGAGGGARPGGALPAF